MQGKTKERYIDVVEAQGCLNVVFLPTGKILAKFIGSRRAGTVSNMKLIGTIIHAYEVYLEEVYGL